MILNITPENRKKHVVSSRVKQLIAWKMMKNRISFLLSNHHRNRIANCGQKKPLGKRYGTVTGPLRDRYGKIGRLTIFNYIQYITHQKSETLPLRDRYGTVTAPWQSQVAVQEAQDTHGVVPFRSKSTKTCTIFDLKISSIMEAAS